jgi:hypothetical protein
MNGITLIDKHFFGLWIKDFDVALNTNRTLLIGFEIGCWGAVGCLVVVIMVS